MKEIFGHHKNFFVFSKKKTWRTMYVSRNENLQKPRENCFAHHSPGFPVSTFFFGKKLKKRKKNDNLPWSTNPLEHGVCIMNPLEHRVCIMNPLEHGVCIMNPLEHGVCIMNPLEHESPGARTPWSKNPLKNESPKAPIPLKNESRIYV